MIIPWPRIPEDHPDRAIECQFHLEPAFQDLVSRATQAGWTEDDVAMAMVDLSHNHLKGIIADRRTAGETAVAQQMVKAMEGGRT
jgi:hypothetical protein